MECSQLSATIGGYALVLATDFEATFSRRFGQDIQSRTGIRWTVARPVGRRNWITQILLSARRRFETPTLAFNAAAALGVALDWTGRTLSIATPDGGEWTLSEAALKSASARVNGFFLDLSFEVVGGAFLELSLPDPVFPGTVPGAGPVLDTAGEEILDTAGESISDTSTPE